MQATTSSETVIFCYRDQDYEIPQCPADDPAKFWANSHGVGHVPFYGAPFSTGDDRFFHGEGGRQRKLFGTSEWLYYPIEFSRALLGVGIHNEVYCHSGRTVRDGEYVD